MKRNIVLLTMILCLCSCGDAVPKTQEVAMLANAGAAVLTTAQVGDLAPDQWPSAISTLHPEHVHVAEEGLYIATWSSFVRERGVFVPRDPGFVPEAGTDPSYVPIRKGVYAYEIKG